MTRIFRRVRFFLTFRLPCMKGGTAPHSDCMVKLSCSPTVPGRQEEFDGIPAGCFFIDNFPRNAAIKAIYCGQGMARLWDAAKGRVLQRRGMLLLLHHSAIVCMSPAIHTKIWVRSTKTLLHTIQTLPSSVIFCSAAWNINRFKRTRFSSYVKGWSRSFHYIFEAKETKWLQF